MMVRCSTVAFLALFAVNLHATTEVNVDNETQTLHADLVSDVDPQVDDDTFAYDVTLVDDGDVSAAIDDYADEELFAANGLTSLFGYRRAARREYRHHGRARSGGRCGRGRRCAGHTSGVASWYGPGFHGAKTANGERFNSRAMTAASLTYCFNSLVRVSYHGRAVVVRINDAGPYVRGRVIDLSRAAAEGLGLSTGSVSIDQVRCEL